MVFTENDMKARLASLREQGKKALSAIELDFEEHFGWLESVRDGVKNGTINVRSVLVPKTPGKKPQAHLTAITETLESSIELDDVRITRSSTQKKRVSRKAQSKKAAFKVKPEVVLDEEDDNIQIYVPTKPQKRLSEETIDSASKRLCGNRSSETTSRDSGLSSVGSHNTRGSTFGVIIKHEICTSKNTSLQSTATVDTAEDNSCDDPSTSEASTLSSVVQSSAAESPSASDTRKKRSMSAGRGTYVVKQEPRCSRSVSEPRDSTNSGDKTSFSNSGANATFTLVASSSTSAQLKQANSLGLPIIKAPPAHLLKGESVKKVVKAFEAMSEDREVEHECMAPPTMPPPTKLQPAAKTALPPMPSSLDDALNAPTRVTRTKTRAMAKAAADEEKKSSKPQDEVISSLVSRSLMSPTNYQHKGLAAKTIEKKADDYFGKENVTLTSYKIVTKPFGSASKQPLSFLKASTPLNRMTPSTPSQSASVSFSATRPINNLVSSVESFIFKPVVNHESKPSREENLQKLAAKAEVASKKKEEIIKAQMEERVKKRQEKRLKVCAAREAMEKEKLETQQKLEREREEKQKQLQTEREEKLRQEYIKKKRLALLKAAETEERRRQEEAVRLAKLKQQEEEHRRIAAQRKKEQEEAERKQMERMQQEREAAAHRAKEAEKQAKETALKSKKTSKAQLDQTFTSESHEMTPAPEDRKAVPAPSADNYGIDDAGTDDSSEDESKPKKTVPLWAQSKQRLPRLMDDYEIKHNQMFVFFESKKSTPDLSKIFTAIDRRQLIRKSSAVWRTPPVKY